MERYSRASTYSNKKKQTSKPESWKKAKENECRWRSRKMHTNSHLYFVKIIFLLLSASPFSFTRQFRVAFFCCCAALRVHAIEPSNRMANYTKYINTYLVLCMESVLTSNVEILFWLSRSLARDTRKLRYYYRYNNNTIPMSVSPC